MVARSTSLVAWLNIKGNFPETSSGIVGKGLIQSILDLLLSLDTPRRMGLAGTPSSRGYRTHAILANLVIAPNQLVVHAIVKSPDVFVFFKIGEIRKALFKAVLRRRGNVDPIVGRMRPIPVSLFEGSVFVAIAIAVTAVALVAVAYFISLPILAILTSM